MVISNCASMVLSRLPSLSRESVNFMTDHLGVSCGIQYTLSPDNWGSEDKATMAELDDHRGKTGWLEIVVHSHQRPALWSVEHVWPLQQVNRRSDFPSHWDQPSNWTVQQASVLESYVIVSENLQWFLSLLTGAFGRLPVMCNNPRHVWTKDSLELAYVLLIWRT